MKPIIFSKKLLKWYEQYGRHDLPWQINPTPYRVWISEIMLQQTQVATVIPYYLKFMESFPTVKSLANTTEDNVLSHWSGLGYYARARNIYKTAKIIVEKYKGKFPETVEVMQELPGIGESTAGAIISFSLQKKAIILDGNVKRVLARYYAIDKPINQKDTMDAMWNLAKKLTPEKNAHSYNQAIMDLGATLCTRSKPRCTDCPFVGDCQAFQNNNPTAYPAKTIKKTRPTKKTRLLIIYNHKKEILLAKRKSKGIWGGLWSFPECDTTPKEFIFQDATVKLKWIDELAEITHQFTHFVLTILPVRFSVTQKTAEKLASPELFWYTLNSDLPGGVAAPVTKILKALT